MQPVPGLPVQPLLANGRYRRLWCFSAGGINIGLIICGFFVYFSSLLCCPLCFQGSAQTRQWECFLVFGNFSLFKAPFPGRSSIPPSFVSFFVFYIFSYLLSKTMVWIYSVFKCPFDEFVGEKVFSLSYSSAILAPPPKILLLTTFIMLYFRSPEFIYLLTENLPLTDFSLFPPCFDSW